ncbi:MAG: PA14 domain-containing protein [Myxococcales bacterium]
MSDPGQASTPSLRARLAAHWPELAAAGAFLVASIALTWPMTAHFTSHLGGDPGDPFQTLWSWSWMHDALTGLKNPFFTDRVYYPQGSTLVFETFDIPTAVLTVPLWWVLPPFGVYNAGVLFAFWLTAYGMYRLVKELTGDRLVAAAAGILFTATPYHLAHVQGHMHLTSMGWLPLYFLYLVRMLEGRAKLRDALLGGLFLALASLASWYHLLYAIIATLVLFLDAAIRLRKSFFAKPFFFQAISLAGTYLVVAGPLLVAILVAKAQEPITGAHDAVRFSGDLYAFFLPNLAQGWGHWLGGHAFRWTGNASETALYIGYSVLVLAILAAIIAGSRARVWLFVGLFGAVMALGPKLHVDGAVKDVSLPYAWLEKLMPQLEFMGVPVRVGYVMYLGLIVCAAFGMAKLREKLSAPLLKLAVVLVPCTVGMVEYLPRRFMETEAAPPKPMLQWAKIPKNFAVLDISDDYRMMYHATLHHKPMTRGNLTRSPDRLEKWYWSLPVIEAILHPGVFRAQPIVERTDGRIDFYWGGGGPPDPRLRPDSYRVEWMGEVKVPREGEWTFYLTSDDGSYLDVDGKRLIENGGSHAMQERDGKVKLTAGPHAIKVLFEQFGGDAGIRFEWEGPGQPRQIVPAEALRPELKGVYLQGARTCTIERGEGRRALREIGVRYVVTNYGGNECVQNALGLPETYRGEGVRIFEVPESD